MAKSLVLIGTNDIGKLKKYRTDAWTWDGGMLWVNDSGWIYLASPRVRIGRLVHRHPLRAADFLAWLTENQIHIEKIYREPETVFKLELEMLWRYQENAMIQGIVANCLK